MQGFGRWGSILGNVLIAFGAPVFVTSLVATATAGRSREADVVAAVAGAVFVIAGLVVTIAAGRQRQAPQVQPERPYPHMVLPVEPKTVRPIEPLPLTLNTLDDYYARPDGEFDDVPLFPPQPPAVPRPRNARGWATAGDRFCEPSVTGTRSSGTRRRPPA